MTLLERFNHMMSCPDKFIDLATEHLIVDTRDHLPIFRATHGQILEIGCDVGNSTSAFLLGADEHDGHVTSIDINPACRLNFPDNPRWTFILGDSLAPKTVRLLDGLMFDALFVDGNHSYEAARSDIFTYAKLVRPGGTIMVHDVLHPEFPGVRRAFEEAAVLGASEIKPGSWGLGVIRT